MLRAALWKLLPLGILFRVSLLLCYYFSSVPRTRAKKFNVPRFPDVRRAMEI